MKLLAIFLATAGLASAACKIGSVAAPCYASEPLLANGATTYTYPAGTNIAPSCVKQWSGGDSL